jgi:hypothetical protein
MSTASRFSRCAFRPRLLPRRSFVQKLAAAPALFSLRSLAGEPAVAKGQPKSFGPRGQTVSAAGEIKELRDPETSARVVQLTGGDSDNVHLYFTSESFLADSNRVVFGSNTSPWPTSRACRPASRRFGPIRASAETSYGGYHERTHD